ncbi:MAG: SGNH/GDSL hydrolase family protein [Bacteroidota bacterium]
MKKELNRRSFITNAAIGALAALAIPEIASAAFAEGNGKRIALNANDIMLFQGDSITDSGRDKKNTTANNVACMGSGYALMAGSDLLVNHPNLNLQIYNKGISGDKVYQLADRWDAQCLQLKPNVLSILVGVNDHWAVKKHGYTGTIETFRNDYKNLLDRTKQALPDVKIIIGEPYAVIGVKEVDETWYPKFDEFRAASRELADEFKAGFIPYQAVYDKAIKFAPGAYWTLDGVHPNMAGITLMAHAWLEAVK